MPRGPLGKLTAAAAALYEKLPTAAEMEASGFLPEDFEGDPVEVWPEMWPAVELFCRLGTQWHVSPAGGATGLRYEALYPLLDRHCADPDDWQQLFDDVRVMERAALDTMQNN